MTDPGFETDDPKIKYNWNFWLYSPYTGFTCILNNQQPGEVISQLVGDQPMNDFGSGWPVNGIIFGYDPSRILSIVGPKDNRSGLPHLHIGCQVPNPNSANFEPFFGFDHTSNSLCQNQNSPCEGNPFLEIDNLFLLSPIDENK